MSAAQQPRISPGVALIEFVALLGPTVGRDHFWPRLGHWELSAMLLVCRQFVEHLAPSDSASKCAWFRIAQQQHFSPGSPFYPPEDPDVTFDDVLETEFQGDPRALFRKIPFFRGDGVYYHVVPRVRLLYVVDDLVFPLINLSCSKLRSSAKQSIG
jgi:hypothetical protein